eukprot:359282-Pleurochrysis_carterae.AAC.1
MGVGHAMARQSMPTANATSGRRLPARRASVVRWRRARARVGRQPARPRGGKCPPYAVCTKLARASRGERSGGFRRLVSPTRVPRPRRSNERTTPPENKLLVRRWGTESEDAGIRRGLREAVAQEPWEKGALPSPASLSHAVDGLLDSADAGTPVRANGGVARRSMAVHDLALLQLALEVCGNEIPPAHEHTCASGDGGERSKGCGPHGSAEGLVVIHAGRLSAALHT